MTESAKPAPSASPNIAAAKARAPSGASSTAAIPATTRHRVHERTGEELGDREDLEARRERGDRVRRARADERDEDQTPAAETVGERDDHERHEHADARDRERQAEVGVGAVERVGDRVAVLREQRSAEVRDQRDAATSAARRAACSPVNVTGGTSRQRDAVARRRGRGRPRRARGRRRSGAAPRRRASPGSSRTSRRRGRRGRPCASSRTRSWPRRQRARLPTVSTVPVERHRVERGTRRAPCRRRGRRARVADGFERRVDRGESERRTCGMLRRPPSRGEDPHGQRSPRRPAPAFTLTDQHGKKVKLSDFKGKKVVVYFYPKADTPGCTTQSCDLRDAEPDLKKLKAKVLGISPDAPGEAEEVRREVRPRLPAARRRRPHRRREVRRVGREDELRPQVHGHHPLRVRHRRGGQDRRRLLQGQPQGHSCAGYEGTVRRQVGPPEGADL